MPQLTLDEQWTINHAFKSWCKKESVSVTGTEENWHHSYNVFCFLVWLQSKDLIAQTVLKVLKEVSPHT